MSKPGARPSSGNIGYMPITQSRRWNRQPLPTGKSEDDRVGGGVSLTAASGAGISTATSTHSSGYGNKNKGYSTPPNGLRDDAKSFDSSTQDNSTRSSGIDTSPTSIDSDNNKSAASQPCSTTSVQPDANGSGNVSGNAAALRLMMNSYENSRHRSRSAIQCTTGVDQNRSEDRNSTTQSSPAKAVTRENTAVAETQTHVGRAEQHIGKTQHEIDDGFHNGNGNTRFLYNQQGPSTYPIGYGPHQEQARDNLTPYGNGQQNQHAYQNQRTPASSARISGYSPQHQGAGNGIPRVIDNRGPYQEPKAENSTFGRGNGHRHDSASNGSVTQYYGNAQPGTSMALVQHGHKPTHTQLTVGPMDLGTPEKAIMTNRSEMLQALTEHGQPRLSDLFDQRFLPFIETYKLTFPSEENGVVAIRNIPYETTRGEIIALLGKSSKILNDRHEPVHIIMDRVTSKTQDAYCELSSLNAAIELVDRFKRGAENGRIGRLGNRFVEVELSSQTNLMLALFPNTSNGVNWIGPNPQIITGARFPWEDFKGFFTEEEMIMLSKHVENPQRSLFAKTCPERPHECMISTLRKIPWHKAENITIKQRHAVYEAALKMIVTLHSKINRNDYKNSAEGVRLTPQLLDRLVTAAMLCPGFSVAQKHNIATVAGLPESKCREFNQPRFPDSWWHQWTLGPRPGMPIDVLEWYIAVIRAETNRVVQSLDISQRMPLQSLMQRVNGYWGYFWAEVNFPTGQDWDDMSLASCSRLEWQAFERIITRAIQGGNIPLSYTVESNHINPAFANGPAQLTYQRY